MNESSTSLNPIKQATDFLKQTSQGNFLKYLESLPEASKLALCTQISQLDLDVLAQLLLEPHKAIDPMQTGELAPVVVQPLSGAKAIEGRYFLKTGRLAAFVVAGGQGSRLGFEGPKGCFGVTPVRGCSLFEVFAHRILAAEHRYGVNIPWVVMTSPLNHQATLDFFEKNAYFGLQKEQLFFFSQGMLPAVDQKSGEFLLESPTSLALTPDGHGGAIRGLFKSGAFEWLRARGISTLSYFQVDNPLVQIADEAFVGAHHASGSEFSSKSVAKSDPSEKVGVFAVRDGETTIIEYSDMSPQQTAQRNEQGDLTFAEGNVAIHLLELSFLEKIAAEALLPYHRALKKVAHVDYQGNQITPDKPNAVKFEQFIFDAIPLARLPIVARTTSDEFAPVKNAQGHDSPETSRQAQLRVWAKWFAQTGIPLPCDNQGVPMVRFEIDPVYADNAQELADRLASESDPMPRNGRVYA